MSLPPKTATCPQMTWKTDRSVSELWTVQFEILKTETELGMLNSFFLKFEFQLVKFELNSNFVYVPDFQWRQLSLGLYSHSDVAMP